MSMTYLTRLFLVKLLILTTLVPAWGQEQSRFSGFYHGTWQTLSDQGPGPNTGDLAMTLRIDNAGTVAGSMVFFTGSHAAHYKISGRITDGGQTQITAIYGDGPQSVLAQGQFDPAKTTIVGDYTVHVGSESMRGVWSASGCYQTVIAE